MFVGLSPPLDQAFVGCVASQILDVGVWLEVLSGGSELGGLACITLGSLRLATERFIPEYAFPYMTTLKAELLSCLVQSETSSWGSLKLRFQVCAASCWMMIMMQMMMMMTMMMMVMRRKMMGLIVSSWIHKSCMTVVYHNSRYRVRQCH